MAKKIWIFLGGAAFFFLMGVIAIPVANRVVPYEIRSFVKNQFSSAVSTAEVLHTHFYNVTATKVQSPSMGRYGGLELIGDRVMLSNRFGQMWISKGEDFLPLKFAVPTNVEAFESADDAMATQLKNMPGWPERIKPLFGVKDLISKPIVGGLRLYASYLYWNGESHCVTVRVSSIDIKANGDTYEAMTQAGWQQRFESSPCLKLADEGNRIMPDEAGSRMAFLSDKEMIITMGDFGRMGLPGGPEYAQLENASYGKVLRIDLDTGAASNYSIGHRNPQGIVVTGSGEIFTTEHGPHGGDELNLIEQGTNYGWPRVSFGRNCSDLINCKPEDLLHNLDHALHKNLGSHEGYTRPIFSWVPSIGTSNLVEVSGAEFDYWRGDLLVSSLRQGTLFRLRVREGRVVYVEKIIEKAGRIRDLAMLPDGRIVLKIDRTGILTYLSVNSSRVEELAASCRACHAVSADESSGLGPNLWNIVGRDVAADDNFSYSQALQNMGGSWDRQKLKGFIQDPTSTVPGTAMSFAVESDEDVELLLDFLETLSD